MTEGPNTPPAGDPNRDDAAAGGAQGAPPPSGPPSGGPGGAPPPAPQAPAGATGVGEPADLGTRFLARLIDYILLFIVNAIISSVIIFGAIFSAAQGGVLGGGGFGPTAVTAIVAAAIYLGYFAFMESNQGKTVGKMLLKLETRGPGGGKPTMEEAVKRNAWVALGIVGVIPFVGWFLAPLVQLAAAVYIAVTINNDTVGRKGWHDQFAGGTQVIKVG